MKAKVSYPGKRGIFMFLALFMFASASFAQVFIPATAYENTYPAATLPGNTPSCYSFGSIGFGTVGSFDTYLAAVNGGMVWRMTAVGVPSSIFNQGLKPYPNCQDINVGFMIDGSGTNLAVVAYYRNGVGHFYDVYKWTPTGLTLMSSTALSALPNYYRISMDSHKTYGITIVWETPSILYAVTGLSGVFTAPVALNGTGGMQRPDVAFSHVSALNVHFVYNQPTGPGTYKIIESVADFYLLNAAVGSYPVTMQDVNPVGAAGLLTASIDAPDHYTVENWAYTYSPNGADVFTRSIDFNTTGIPVTKNVVNGTLGNAPMFAKELRPRLAYNQGCNSFHVGWYSSYGVGPVGQCYFTEQIKESACCLASSPDYELIAANSNFPPGASLNSIAFSKQNDASPFLYTVFIDNTGLHHKFHQWPNTASFRTSSNSVSNCSPKSSAAGSAGLARQLSVGPNPFSENVNLYVPASVQNETMQVSLIDITGKLFLNFEGVASNAPAAIEQATKGLKNGTYFLSATVKAVNIHQNFKLQCVGNSDR